jgi:hypothetical protein
MNLDTFTSKLYFYWLCALSGAVAAIFVILAWT